MTLIFYDLIGGLKLRKFDEINLLIASFSHKPDIISIETNPFLYYFSNSIEHYALDFIIL